MAQSSTVLYEGMLPTIRAQSVIAQRILGNVMFCWFMEEIIYV